MSYEELTRIQNGINILKNTYNNYDDDYIYYEILDNISDTCSIKKSLLELDSINCISGDKPIFDSEKIQNINIPILPIEAQTQIVEYLDKLEGKKNNICEEINEIDVLMKDVITQSYS